MKVILIGDTDNPLAEVELRRGETIKLERGAMVYMQDVELEGKTNSNSKGLGGFLKAAAKSMVSGESMFITYATGTGEHGKIGIAPHVSGVIRKLEVGTRQYRLNTGAFLACDDTVTYNMVSQNVGKAMFGGTGGFFVMETSGNGDLLINAFADMIELQVTEDKPLVIDNEHVVAWDANLDYSIRVASGTFGFTSGEGLVNEFHGYGKVYIQTRSVPRLAQALQPFITTSSN